MRKFILKRFLQLIPTLFGVTILTFLIISAVPGDPALIIAGENASSEEVESIREQLGTDEPLIYQYTDYIKGIFKGDFGTSLRTDTPVLQEIFSRLPVSMTIISFSIIIMSVVGITAGILSAIKPNGFIDNIVMSFALFGISMPTFWIGLMFIIFFSSYLHLLPSGGDTEIKHFILPTLVLSIATSGIIARLARSSMLEKIDEDFNRTARAKGIKEKVVIYKHTLKNALIPIVTIIGMEFGTLLGGTVLVETVFSMNGIGRYIVDAIQYRDFPAVQGSILFVSLAFVLAMLIVDLSYMIIDPRIRQNN
ncbi:MAG TPA: ABC transporter permease [Pseudogracilibacillus sp.]|nr:ABC transporter permease [Pseudogracilibacillus sp.]